MDLKPTGNIAGSRTVLVRNMIVKRGEPLDFDYMGASPVLPPRVPSSLCKSAGPELKKKGDTLSFQVIIFHDLPQTTFSQTMEAQLRNLGRNWKYSRKTHRYNLLLFERSSKKSCPRISCVWCPVGLMDDRHLSCFSFAAAADDLRSVCL